MKNYNSLKIATPQYIILYHINLCKNFVMVHQNNILPLLEIVSINHKDDVKSTF